jgi:hypothetical protein
MPQLFDKTVGSRSEVGHGTAEHTSGGLYKDDLVLGSDGNWKSKKKAGHVPAQLKPFIAAHAKVLKNKHVPKSGGSFDDYTIKKGTKAYKDFMKLAKK